jgi:hypothetical protein
MLMVIARPLLPFRFLLATSALVLGACAAPLPLKESISPPHYAVGDHWQYRVTDGLRRNALSTLDVEVILVDGGIATMHLTYVNEYGTTEKTEQIDADGNVRAGSFRNERYRLFSPALKLIDFPIGQRSPWRQVVPTYRPDTQLDDSIMIYGEVQGRVPVTVPAGSYEAVAIYRILQLDDGEFWRSKTTRRDSVRYASEVKGVVREVRDAEYVETGSGPDFATIRTEYTTTELVSFTPGR